MGGIISSNYHYYIDAYMHLYSLPFSSSFSFSSFPPPLSPFFSFPPVPPFPPL